MNAFLHWSPAPDALASHAIALVTVAPMIGACAAALAPNGRFALVISAATAAFSFWMALALLGEVARHGVVSYEMGGWPAPLGIVFHADALSVLFALIVTGATLASVLSSAGYTRTELSRSQRPLYHAGVLLTLSGLAGLTVTGDAFNAFVFLEVSSIGAYALVAMGAKADRRALPAAFNYLIIGTVGATFYVLGVGLLYAQTGTLTLADMARHIQASEPNFVTGAAFAFILAGLGVKAAMFPLHVWLPEVYARSPAPVAAILSAAAGKAALYLLFRIAFGVFNTGWAMHLMAVVAAPLAAAGVLFGAFKATRQTELRTILAWSSVSQMGMALLAGAVGGAAGVAAAGLHLLAHALAKSTLFLAISPNGARTPRRTLGDYAGAGRTAPFTMGAFTLALASLVGMPLTAGFLGKWRILEALALAGQWWAVAVMAAASMLAVLYVGRVVETLYVDSPLDVTGAKAEAAPSVRGPVLVLAAALVWIGVSAGPVAELAEEAGRALLPVDAAREAPVAPEAETPEPDSAPQPPAAVPEAEAAP